MKINKLLLISIFSLILTLNLQAQYLEKLAKKTQQKIENEAQKRTEKRINKGVDNVFDKAEEDIDSTVKKDKKKNKSEEKSTETDNSVADTPTTTNSTLTWNQYDFIPGTDIIFEDNQEGEQNGEFPSKWDLVSGVIENANFNNENVIYFRETGNFPNGIVPYFKAPSADYLPEEFTVEFDVYFEKGKYNSINVFFYDAKNKKQKRQKDAMLCFHVNNVKYGLGSTEKQFPNTKASNIDKEKSNWRHIAISFNKRALKVYMDNVRMLNIPNIEENLTGITISPNHTSKEKNLFIKNIRIAKGAVPLYDKFLTDGKFVTTGIKFDVNKATIKPESMGTINYVVKMMQDHPELKFSVEGHTDSDGDDASNQKLSEARAKAVVEEMIKAGISANRLTSKGFGESKPVSTNNTSEEKAQNRRVEFVKK